MKKLLLSLLLSSPVFGQIIIIPQPAVSQSRRGEFLVRPGLSLWSSASCSKERAFLQTYWQEADLPVLTSTPKAKRADVVLVVDTSRQEALGPEGYELIVSPRRISIVGASAAGVFYGLQTLRQMLPKAVGVPIQARQIRDKPRFGQRAFRFDEGQHLEGIVAIKKLLDELALLKFNRFHWHLPTHQGGKSRPPGSFYTPEQIREISRYAEARHSTVVTSTGLLDFWKGDDKQMLKALNLGQSLVISNKAETVLSTPLTNLSLDRVYQFEPIPDQLPEDLRPQILGVGYEYVVQQTSTQPDLFTQLHPRLAAAAEVAWTFAQNKDVARFKAGLAGFYNGAMLR